MKQKSDIDGMKEIHVLVDTFYERASHDPLLAPVFANRFAGKSGALNPLYQYWYSMLFEQNAATEVSFPKHADLPLTHQHFDRWLSIFHETVDDLFTGPRASEAKLAAIKMSEVFRYKMELSNF